MVAQIAPGTSCQVLSLIPKFLLSPSDILSSLSSSESSLPSLLFFSLFSTEEGFKCIIISYSKSAPKQTDRQVTPRVTVFRDNIFIPMCLKTETFSRFLLVSPNSSQHVIKTRWMMTVADGDMDDCHKHQECKLWLHPYSGQFCNTLESYSK